MSATNTNGSATIYDMEDARRRLSDGPGAEYRHAGAWLASVREEAGLSLAEAAAKIHIRDRHLEAIEAIDHDVMPARPYAIGFVRAYAEFLGLDADEVVARFKQDAGYDSPKQVEVEKFEEAERAEAADKPELSLLAVIAILGFIVWCAWQITLPREVRQLGEPTETVEPSAPAPVVRSIPPPPAPENVIEPRLVERVDAIYPMGCLNDAAATETVIVNFTVTAQGRIAGERVASATNGCFGESALIALRRWRFEPRTVDGAPRPAHDQRAEFVFERPL